MTKKQKKREEQKVRAFREWAAMRNEYPTRYLDAKQTVKVEYGSPFWEKAPYEEVIQMKDGSVPKLADLK